MAGSKLGSFLNNSGNRKLVFVLSVLASTLVVAPVAQSCFAVRAERFDAEQLQSKILNLETGLLDFAPKVKLVRDAADRLHATMVANEKIEEFRKLVISEVRVSECHLHSLTVGEREVRRWMEDDDPMSDGSQLDEFEDDETVFVLETQSLNLDVSGNYKSIVTLLNKITASNTILSSNSLKIQTTPASESLTLQWEIVVYNLSLAPAQDDE